MRTFSIHRLLLAVIVTLLVATHSLDVRGQTVEPIRLSAGEVFEITTDTASPSAELNWILTKDRSFQSAARTRFFQSRLTVPGTYVLDVSVQDPVTSENAYRAFTIIVQEGVAPTPPIRDASAALRAILGTDRPGNGGIVLSEEGGLAKLDPSASQGSIDRFSLDLDTTADSDGDGDPRNDVDTSGTSFEQVGTPIHVFMLPRAGREVLLTVSNNRGDPPNTHPVPVSFGVTVGNEQAGTVQHAGPISVTSVGGGLRMSVAVDPNATSGKELLYEWDFGDRTKSLLTTPVHRYGAAGTYSVTVSIRDIASGETILRTTQNIVVTPEAIQEGSSSLSSSTASEPAENEGEGSTGINVGNLIVVGLIVLMLLGIALGLYALLVWLKGKTTHGLQNTLEKLEGTIVHTDEQKPAAVETVKLNKPTSPEVAKAKVLTMEEVSEKELRQTEMKPKAAEPVAASVGPMPDWLKPKPNPGTAPQKAPETKPTPAPETPKPTATPVTPKPTTGAQQKSNDMSAGPVPEWLQPKASPPTIEQSQPKPQSTPPPVAPPPAGTKPTSVAPKPASTAAPKPVVQPSSPTPASKPTPATEPKPIPQAPAPHPKKDEGEPPIAIISADSLKK